MTPDKAATAGADLCTNSPTELLNTLARLTQPDSWKPRRRGLGTGHIDALGDIDLTRPEHRYTNPNRFTRIDALEPLSNGINEC
ncbi:hypothetical protein [Nocardia pseudovaccinii]|uniref:hypothetical protein n=1 Tax=Nocardia pseudovaccinii TaxID=189540 RepID=UPI0007A4EC40|nr:hypothetical protein [Nocardia pseudovaccinii]